VDQNTMHPSETKQNNTSLTEQMLFYIWNKAEQYFIDWTDAVLHLK
jgi:hypothetical protein